MRIEHPQLQAMSGVCDVAGSTAAQPRYRRSGKAEAAKGVE